MDQRSLHRIELGTNTNVRVSILLEGRPIIVGRLHDVSADGARVVVPSLAGALLSAGQPVTLVLIGANIVKPLRVAAVVRQRRTEGSGGAAVEHYGFEFTNKEGFDELLIEQDLHILFNRRRTRRVQPDTALPLDVLIEDAASGMWASGHLPDLSTAGSGILVTSKVDSRFAGNDRLGVAFRLSGGPGELRFEGIVRHRTPQDGGVRYGIEFDGERTQRFREQQAVPAKYLARCLRELLRAGAR